MLEFIPNHPFPIGHVWWNVSWVDTVAAIRSAWVPTVVGPGLINAYGMTRWINNDDDLTDMCNILLTWTNEGYPTKPVDGYV